jgi:glycopeptide antibiotics resistance protein
MNNSALDLIINVCGAIVGLGILMVVLRAWKKRDNAKQAAKKSAAEKK